jgi:DNA polymerase-3 subunit gamma/tau
MRDALSILDKIVSFTGGHLTYTNTLEHLNILDEDYFFKLLQFATEQKLSESLLLFDDINQKGFEGDTLLEGLTEFLRNLLVSKDVKAAILLEVAEDFRDKYLQAANELSANWIIAALNTIHDAAMDYKQARNKRLCVEMALIKLCYLNQAVEIVSGDANGITKKKLVDDAKPVAFKNISFIKLKEETPIAAPVKKEPVQHASLTIAHEKPIERKVENPIAKPVTETKSGGFGSLSKIRAKILEQEQQNAPVTAFNIDTLQKAWEIYTTKLEAEKKHPSVTQFKAAQLRIDDENNFTITTEGKVQQKFIENERSGLIHFLQDYFSNKYLKYGMEIVEQEQVEVDETKALPAKQQYQLLIEKYPLIKELRDRLNLELDY